MIFHNKTQIAPYSFDSNCSEELKKQPFGYEFPVVYILRNKNTAYIGETVNIAYRLKCHFRSEEKKCLDSVHIIHNESFNKSAILDLENFLIAHISADGNYKLQNANKGQLPHNYYKCEQYRKEFEQIWQQLKKEGLVHHEIKEIQNFDLYKYSPYKTLTADQYRIVEEIIQNLTADLSNHVPSRSTIIRGGSGTGKSVLGMFLLKLLADAEPRQQTESEASESTEENLNLAVGQIPVKLKIGYVVPTRNFRATLKKVIQAMTPSVKHSDNVSEVVLPQILSPSEVAGSKTIYDLLIVDESHRLRRRKGLSGTYYDLFDKSNRKLGLPKEGTELDWILNRSKYQLFFYDVEQSVKPSDVPKKDFDNLLNDSDTHQYELISQLRCKGGKDYIQYLYDIFEDADPQKITFKGYRFRLFGDVNRMVRAIIRLDKKHGLCRNVAGYGWKWRTKGKGKKKTAKELLKQGLYDIEISGHKYIWNMQDNNWINAPDSVNQIGCIHTIQGYDLNYAGVIFGPEIDYDDAMGKIIIHKDKYMDIKGKESASEDELLTYIKNIYKTNLARGILGTYVYVYNENLRQHLKKYIDCN